VPNVSGFAGLSFRYTNAKLSLGYHADVFFGAMEGGIDTAKSENRGFFGPFAVISTRIGASSTTLSSVAGTFAFLNFNL
jgi:hypothetical protein